MTSFLSQHFDILKRHVLTIADLRNISPSDCKTLSLLIAKKTNQQVSETTLKRVYGFAYSKFKPSLFTLDAMAKYCDYFGWVDFCENHDAKAKKTDTKDLCWEKIKHNADKITSFTLQALKNRSGIPFNQTIKRKFIDDHFNAFLKDDYTATVFTAPAGYGKTIALCHWIEDKLTMNAVGASNDIILFFSSNALINVFISGKDINEWLLSLLGYGNEKDFSALLDIKNKHNGNFYLVIDGLDEHMFKSDQFQMLINQIMDIFSFYEYHDGFKLVLTMRSATWLNNRHELEDFREKCFIGFPIREDVLVNVPLFSNQEIKELSKKINPLAQNNVSVEVAENFNHPLYFQYYYKQHKENFSLNDVDHVSIYELISTFILNKIYLGPHSTEKSLLTKLLIENMDLSNGKFEVNKFKFTEQIKQYHHAYHDLLAIGFIRELNKSGDMQYNTVIVFSNDNFLNYTIARHLLYHNNNTFDTHLIQSLNSLFKCERKLAILKWTIIYAVRNGQNDICEFLSEVGLNPKERADLIMFLGDLLFKEYASLTKTEALAEYFKGDCSDHLFDYVFGLEFINTDYKKALNALLLFKLTNKKKILIYTALAAIAVIQLDLNKLEEHLSNLKSFPQEDLQSLAINPLSCLETIYYYFKYGIVKNEAFIELTRFYFNPPKSGDMVKGNSENDILYLLAVYTLSICKNPVKLLRLTNTIKKVYKRTGPDANAYNFMLNTMVAEAYIQSGKMDEATKMYNDIAKTYDIENKAYTPFMRSSFYLLKLNIGLSNNKKAGAQELMKPLVYVSDECDFKFVKTQGLIYVLKNKLLHKTEIDFYKRSYYDFIKIIRESGFREESFIGNESIMAIK